MFLTIELSTYANLNYLKKMFICIKMDLGLSNLQRLIYHKTQTNNQLTDLPTKPNQTDLQNWSLTVWCSLVSFPG